VRVQVAVFLGVMVLLLVPVGVAGALTEHEAGENQAEATSVQGKSTVSVRSHDEQTVEEQSSVASDPSEAVRSTRVSNIKQRVERSNSSVAVSGEIASERAGTRRAPAGAGAEVTPKEMGNLRKTRPASGGTGVPRGRELQIAREDIVARPVGRISKEIAREDIVARPVGRISKEKYKELYKKSAEKYGFGADWYVLAAVGWVESRHGENMGPSSSGAMGPMQFLPSTWKTSGVDGNHDGVKNIMDPRDAIPAAASYLKRGGAPKDWFAALYTYNHSDQYVRDVLGSAERYRQLAKDHEVGPYK